METPTASTYQFGPFEVNVSSGELLKEGRRVKLQEQPFRLLVILLENGGHVVSREEIRPRIWQEPRFIMPVTGRLPSADTRVEEVR